MIHHICVPPQIQQQVLLLWGDSDEIISPDLAKKWQATLGPSKCKLVMVERAGHSPHLEQADFVAQQVLSFIESQVVKTERVAEAKVAEDVQVPA